MIPVCSVLMAAGILDPNNVCLPHYAFTADHDQGNADSVLHCCPTDQLNSPMGDPHSVAHHHDPVKSMDPYRSPVSLTLHSLLAPFGYLGRLNHATCASDVTANGHMLEDDSTRGLHSLGNDNTGIELTDDNQTSSSSEPGATAQTAALITDLAQRLAEEEQAGVVVDEFEPADMNDCPPSHEAALRFIDGMRTATEFLRLPNTVGQIVLRDLTVLSPQGYINLAIFKAKYMWFCQ